MVTCNRLYAHLVMISIAEVYLNDDTVFTDKPWPDKIVYEGSLRHEVPQVLQADVLGQLLHTACDHLGQ
jgi:hypothetical protein